MRVRLHFTLPRSTAALSCAIVLLAACSMAIAQEVSLPGQASEAAPNSKVLLIGPPRVGAVEWYGNDKTDGETLLKRSGLQPGQPAPASKRELEERLEAREDIIQASVEGYCCLGEDVVLYIGVVENGSKPFPLHSPPSEDLALPVKLDLVYQRLLRALENAYERGATGESYTRGYPISEDDEARRAQETLALIVDPYVDDLGEVLSRSADEQTRAAAAYILAYTKEKVKAEGYLQYALRDFDPDVRQNALRSLEFFRRSFEASPPAPDEFGRVPRISTTWLIEMLNSVVWHDRVEAARMLLRLSKPDDTSMLAQLEERALNSLAQMANWRIAEHAEPAYILLGRIAQLPEDQVKQSLATGKRQVVLQPIRERAKSKKRFLIF